MNNESLLKKIGVWMLIGILAIVTLKVGLALAKIALGMVFFVLFTLGPILIIGWLALKALRYFSRDRSETAAI